MWTSQLPRAQSQLQLVSPLKLARISRLSCSADLVDGDSSGKSSACTQPFLVNPQQSSVLAGARSPEHWLTSPAPAGGAVVRLRGSMEGQVIVPQSVTIPAGSISATFTTTPAPETPFPRWVFIQGNYGTPADRRRASSRSIPLPARPRCWRSAQPVRIVIGGHSGRATVALVIPAPAGGGVV